MLDFTLLFLFHFFYIFSLKICQKNKMLDFSLLFFFFSIKRVWVVFYNLENVKQHQAELVKGRKDKRYLSEKVKKKKIVPIKLKKWYKQKEKTKKICQKKVCLTGTVRCPLTQPNLILVKEMDLWVMWVILIVVDCYCPVISYYFILRRS